MKIGCHVNANYCDYFAKLYLTRSTLVVYAGIINCLEILFSVFCVLCLSKFNFNSSFTKKEPFISTWSLVSLPRIWALCSTLSHPLFTRPEIWTNFLHYIPFYSIDQPDMRNANVQHPVHVSRKTSLFVVYGRREEAMEAEDLYIKPGMFCPIE